jgi:hypothetical protein
MVVGDRLHIGMLDFFGKPMPQPGGGAQNGSLWWVCDRDGKNARKVADNLLRIRTIQHSSHYGLIAWCDLHDSLPRWVCNELVLDKSPEKK